MTKNVHAKVVGTSPRNGGRWLIALALLAAAGCQDYKWRWDYQQAEQQARQQNKYLFVFYKWWLSNDSNRMHDYINADPAVAAQLQDTINLLLEKDSSPEYANYLAKYGVTAPPAFVIVAPDGTYYVAGGFIPKDRFIEFIKNAKAGRSPSGKRPATAPAKGR